MIEVVLAAALSAHVLLQASPRQSLPEASAVLDHYVQATHGANLAKQSTVLIIDFSVRDAAGTTYYATVYRGRAGRLRTVVDDDDNPRERGAADGLVWSFSKPNGAQLLKGNIADHVLAETHGFSGGSLAAFAAGWGGSFQTSDWREAFSSAKSIAETTIHNKRCYEVLLTRRDGSTLRGWYEAQSGLLARESTTEFDQNGHEQVYETDVVEYATSLGFVYPSLLQVKSGLSTFTVSINSVARESATSLSAFEVPHEVARIIAQAKTPDGMPNAVDLIEHFVQETTGVHTRDSISSEIIKASLSLPEANLEIPMTFYVRGRNNYFSLDVPTMGKFEYGSNGNIAWQRSVVLGPKLMPRTRFNGFLGPDIGEILAWTDEGLTVRSVRKEEVEGSSCYVVEMGAKKDGTFAEAYFDAKTGYLVRMNTPAQAGAAAEQVTLGDYRAENGFTIAHHIETTLAGKAVRITITEMHLNALIPDSIFTIPEDVADLLQQQQRQQAQRTDSDLSARPTLRRHPAH